MYKPSKCPQITAVFKLGKHGICFITKLNFTKTLQTGNCNIAAWKVTPTVQTEKYLFNGYTFTKGTLPETDSKGP